ncbi:trypsin-like serine peptidase [Botrimarina mediterranea]|uniref:trypsin-like serine peptidase n=1 Tax=Botrimarina mediterranea TaxID=2528022 RepID=UPI0018D389C1|nr:trypsin-like serine protease [Botrimarina mediterranea]
MSLVACVVTGARADDAADLSRLKSALRIAAGPIDEGQQNNRNSLGTGSVKHWLTYPGELYVTPDSDNELYQGKVAYHFSGRERHADYVLGGQRGTSDHQASGRVTARYEITRSGSVLIKDQKKHGGRGRVGNAILAHIGRLNGQDLRESAQELASDVSADIVFSDLVLVESVADLLQEFATAPPESGDAEFDQADSAEQRQLYETLAAGAAAILHEEKSVLQLQSSIEQAEQGQLLRLVRSLADDLEASGESCRPQAAVLRLFAQQLEGISGDDGHSELSPEAIVDYRDKPAAKKAAELLKSLAKGNERSAGWEELSFNTSTGELRGRAYIRSRHVIKVRVPFDGKKKVVVYDWKVKGDFRGNPSTGDANGTIDFGRGIRIDAKKILQFFPLEAAEASQSSKLEISPVVSTAAHEGESSSVASAITASFRPDLQVERMEKLNELGLASEEEAIGPTDRSIVLHAKQAVNADDLPLVVAADQELPPIETFFFEPPESVCLPDERVRVTNTSTYPYSANCQLIIKFVGGGGARGTGWLMGPRLVVTAGHCVHQGDGGNFFESVEVIPGMNDSARPFGSQVIPSSRLRASNDWKQSGLVQSDYGAILLNSEFLSRTGVSPGSHNIAVARDSDLQGAEILLSGYPGDRPIGQQWMDRDPLQTVQPGRLWYMLDTYGGQSGSASVLTTSAKAVGIHNYGGCPNKSTRITSGVRADLEQWLQESDQP